MILLHFALYLSSRHVLSYCVRCPVPRKRFSTLVVVPSLFTCLRFAIPWSFNVFAGCLSPLPLHSSCLTVSFPNLFIDYNSVVWPVIFISFSLHFTHYHFCVCFCFFRHFASSWCFATTSCHKFVSFTSEFTFGFSCEVCQKHSL